MDGRKDTLTDAALDREIESLLAINPSPEFVARIRARVESEPLPANRWTVWRLATSRAVLLIEAFAVMFIAVTVVWRAWSPIEHAAPSVTAPVQEASVTRPTPPAPSAVARAREGSPRVSVTRGVDRDVRQRVAAPVAPLPEVLIPENEKRGFQLLLEELSDEKSAAVVAEAASGRTTPGPPWLDVAPVVIEPLHEVSAYQGEAQ